MWFPNRTGWECPINSKIYHNSPGGARCPAYGIRGPPLSTCQNWSKNGKLNSPMCQCFALDRLLGVWYSDLESAASLERMRSMQSSKSQSLECIQQTEGKKR